MRRAYVHDGWLPLRVATALFVTSCLLSACTPDYSYERTYFADRKLHAGLDLDEVAKNVPCAAGRDAVAAARRTIDETDIEPAFKKSNRAAVQLAMNQKIDAMTSAVSVARTAAGKCVAEGGLAGLTSLLTREGEVVKLKLAFDEKQQLTEQLEYPLFNEAVALCTKGKLALRYVLPKDLEERRRQSKDNRQVAEARYQVAKLENRTPDAADAVARFNTSAETGLATEETARARVRSVVERVGKPDQFTGEVVLEGSESPRFELRVVKPCAAD